MEIFLYDKIILFAISYQSILFAFILYFLSRKDAISKRILGHYMIINSLYYAINFLYYNKYYQEITYIYYVIIPIIMLIQPFFFFYIKSLTSPTFKCTPKRLLHFIPSFVVLLMNIFLYSFLSSSEKLELLTFSGESTNKILNFYFYLHKDGYHILLSIQALIYFSMTVFYIYKYKKQMLTNFSNTEGVNLNWIVTLIIIFISISVLNELIGNIDKIVFDVNARLSYNIFYMLIISFIGLEGILQKEIYIKTDNENEVVKKDDDNNKYKNSSLNNDLKETIAKELKLYLEKEKPYLNSNLRLNDLSQALNINRQYLSQIINEVYKQNFYTLINTYRINEAKQLFYEKKHKELSIMGIANSVGFNSKSTFNTLFKKLTGNTPSEFISKNSL